MRHTIMFILAVAVAVAILPNHAIAEWECQTAPSEPAAIPLGTEYPYDHTIMGAVVRIRVHDLQALDGTGDLSDEYINDLVAEANGFLQGYVVLSVCGIEDHPIEDYLVGDIYRYFNEPYGVFTRFANSEDAIDVILTHPTMSESHSFAFTEFIVDTKLLLTSDKIHPAILAHEMGHCLGLYHTFEDGLNPPEEPDGSNCDIGGDLVCDTPAEIIAGAYVDEVTCEIHPFYYISFPGYDPDPRNVMAYGPYSCRTNLTPQQFDRMLAMVEFHPVLEAVAELPQAQYADRSLNDSGESQLSYSALPYSAVTIDIDGQAPRDMALSLLRADAQIYTSTSLSQDGGIPEYVPASEVFAVGDAPIGLLGLTVADIDGDGIDDLCGASQTNPRLYVMNGSGKLEDMSDNWGVRQSMLGSAAAAWADYDRDGDVDLLVGTGTFNNDEPDHTMIQRTQDVLLRNDLTSGGGFTDVSASSGISDQHYTACTTVTWGDVNEDGYPDAFVGDIGEFALGLPTEGGCLFVNQGDGTFTEERATRLGSVPYYVNSAIWRDMDNDGDVDLEIAAMFNRRLRTNTGGGVLTSISYTEATDVAHPYSGSRVLDSDLDGYEDVLLLPRAVDDKPRLLTRFPDVDPQTYLNVATAVGLGATGKIGTALVADLNGDGDLDVFLGRDVPRDAGGLPVGDPSEFLFQATSAAGLDAPQNDWIGVRLQSLNAANNTSCIGAKITLTVSGQPRVRYIDGGSGRGGQDDPTIIFGLGSSGGAINGLTVDWPNGYHQVVSLTGTERNEVLVIDDATVLQVVAGSALGTYEIIPNTDLVDWVFTWKTDLYVTPALDRVEFDIASMDPACTGGLVTLTPTMPGVEHTTEHLAGGGMQHTIIWRSRPCQAGCAIIFRGHSAINSDAVSVDTAWRSMTIKFCASRQFPGM